MSRVRRYVKGVDAQRAQAAAKAKRDLFNATVEPPHEALARGMAAHDWDDKPCSSCNAPHACMRHGELRKPTVAYCFKCWKAKVGV